MTTLNVESTILYLRDSGGIQYSTDNENWSAVSWPVTVSYGLSGEFLTVLFVNDLTLPSGDSSAYFVCGSSYIQWGSLDLREDGNPAIITIPNTSNYPGLIQNGSSGSNGKDGISVVNLRVQAAGTTTLAIDGGWIGQSYFGNGATSNWIVGCSSDGDISASGGGIVGANTENLTTLGCFSTGTTNNNGGGIVGISANGVTVDGCWSSGTIGGSAGGLVGANSLNVTVRNSYSTGAIGNGSGGIVGASANTTTVLQSYSLGVIGNNAGGILGSYSSSCLASNCYSNGDLQGTGADGIFGTGATSPTTTNCYIANANWVSSDANSALTGLLTVWIDVGPSNTPYNLRTVGTTPYSLTSVLRSDLDGSYSLNRAGTTSVPSGSTSGTAVFPTGWSYVLLGNTEGTLTIDGSTGAIQTTGETPPGTYTLTVRASINPYSITTLTLTVEEAAAVAAALSALCVCFDKTDVRPALEEYDVVDTFKAGQTFLRDYATNPRMTFASHADYLKYWAARNAKI